MIKYDIEYNSFDGMWWVGEWKTTKTNREFFSPFDGMSFKDKHKAYNKAKELTDDKLDRGIDAVFVSQYLKTE